MPNQAMNTAWGTLAAAEIISLTNKAVLPILPRAEESYGCARKSLGKPVRSIQVQSIEHFYQEVFL